MTEVEDVLGIHASAVNWPVGSGSDFAGVVERATRQMLLFLKTGVGGSTKAQMVQVPFDGPEAASRLTGEIRAAGTNMTWNCWKLPGIRSRASVFYWVTLRRCFLRPR